MSIGGAANGTASFRGLTRRLGPAGDESLVSTSVVDTPLPLIVEPAHANVDLTTWARASRRWIADRLAAHGGLLLRGFRIDSSSQLSDVVEAISTAPLEYTERSSPRREIAERVYTSTEHPADESIFLHNEQSYNLIFPRIIAFHCETPAAGGGATPLADCRRVLARIPAGIRDAFATRRYAYVRTFGTGLGLSWEEAFQCDTRAGVETYCREHGIRPEWLDDGVLRTRQIRDVLAKHPVTGELTWFNHLTFFHIATLSARAQAALSANLPPHLFPNHTTYGDGEPVDASTMAVLRAAYADETVRFEWRQGDILVLDNMLVAHGRDPFTGARRVLVAMAEPTSWADVGVAETHS
jgi:alpha-ketoglutarate-dependent taurine dioxygenase